MVTGRDVIKIALFFLAVMALGVVIIPGQKWPPFPSEETQRIVSVRTADGYIAEVRPGDWAVTETARYQFEAMTWQGIKYEIQDLGPDFWRGHMQICHFEEVEPGRWKFSEYYDSQLVNEIRLLPDGTYRLILPEPFVLLRHVGWIKGD